MGVPVLPPCLSSAGTVQVWGDSAAESVHSRTAGLGGAVPPSDCRVPEAQWQVPWRLQHLRPWTAPALPDSGTGWGGGQAPPAGVPALSGLLCDFGESPALVLGFSSAKRGGRRSPGARMRRRELTAQVRVAPLFVVAAAPAGGKAALLRDPSPQRPGPCPLPTESPAKGENSGSVCLRSPGGQGEGSMWPPGTRSWQRRVRVSLKATVRPLPEPAWRRVSLRNGPSSGPQGRVPAAAGIRSLPPSWDPRPGAGV